MTSYGRGWSLCVSRVKIAPWCTCGASFGRKSLACGQLGLVGRGRCGTLHIKSTPDVRIRTLNAILRFHCQVRRWEDGWARNRIEDYCGESNQLSLCKYALGIIKNDKVLKKMGQSVRRSRLKSWLQWRTHLLLIKSQSHKLQEVCVSLLFYSIMLLFSGASYQCKIS